MSRRALIVGATGLVGSRLLQLLVKDAHYGTVATVGRRSPEQSGDAQHHVTDFSAPELILPATDVLFCCLGTTIRKAGSQAAFRAIDFDLVARIASTAAGAGCDSMIVVSSVGADPSSGNFYLRTKGEMEQTVASLQFSRCGIVRPSLLLGGREEFRAGEQLGKVAARLLNPLMLGPLAQYRAVDAATVAAAMVGLDQADFTGTRIIEGRQLQQFAAT